MKNGNEVLSVEVDQEMIVLLRVHAAAVKITVGEALLTWARCGLDKILAGVAVNGSVTASRDTESNATRRPRKAPAAKRAKYVAPAKTTAEIRDPEPLTFENSKPKPVPPPKLTVIAKPASTCEHIWRYVDHSRRRSDICTLCALRRAHVHNWRIAELDPFAETDVQHGSCACGATREFDPTGGADAKKAMAGFTLKGSTPLAEPIATVNTVAVPHQKERSKYDARCKVCGNHPRSRLHADACNGGRMVTGNGHRTNAEKAAAITAEIG